MEPLLLLIEWNLYCCLLMKYTYVTLGKITTIFLIYYQQQ